MNHQDNSELQRLIQLANASPAQGSDNCSAPMGFATRVISNAWSSREDTSRTLLATMRWGLALASVLMICSIVINFRSLLADKASPESMVSQHVTELILNP